MDYYGKDEEEHPLKALFRLHDIPHYHGDAVRQLFVVAALLSFIAIPVWGDLLPFGTMAQSALGILLVLLAGLTSPHSRWALIYDAVVAGLGALLLEAAAISLYKTQPIDLFAAREACAVLLLCAFYFSVKTVRAMTEGKVGKPEEPWEFENTKE